MAKKEKWIPEDLDEGRVKRYLKRVFGDKAFNKDGTIKISYLDRAIERVKENKRIPKDNRKSLLSALN